MANANAALVVTHVLSWLRRASSEKSSSGNWWMSSGSRPWGMAASSWRNQRRKSQVDR